MTWTVNLGNSSLNTQVSTSIADGSFSYTEILQLLNTVAVGGITPSEMTDLETIYANCTGLFASDYVNKITYNVIKGNKANTTWWGGQKTVADADPQGNLTGSTSEVDAKRLISEWFLGTDLPIAVAGGDTATGKASASSYGYATATGPIYVNGVSASDVNQGFVGTCYLMASLGAIANANPSLITNAITDNGNGSYGVRLYYKDATYYTTVNMALPTDSSGKLPFAANSSQSASGELWVSLFEKAYAQLNSQVNVQGESGWTGESSYQAIEAGRAYPLKEITGLNYVYYARSENVVTDFLAAGAFTVSTASALKQIMIKALAVGSIGYLGSTQFYYDPVNQKKDFVPGHAFMLLGYNSVTDKFIVRNPWGGDGDPNIDYNPQFEVSADIIWQVGRVALTDATIANPVYTYSVSSNAATTATAVSEGGNVTFTITRSGTGFASTVYVSTATGSADNNDIQAVSKTAINFAANESSKTVTVKTRVDTLTEGNETFSLGVFKQASDTTSVATAVGNIKDLQQKSYTYAVVSSTPDTASAVTEGGKIVFTITRSSSSAGADTASTVYVSTAGVSASADDFAGLSKTTVNFAAFDTSKTVSITTLTDNKTEGTEKFTLDLYQNIGDTYKAATSNGYIKDKTLPSFSYAISSNAASTGTATYEGSKVSFTITRSGTGSASTVYLSTESASAGTADFTGFSQKALTFAANQSIAIVTVDINSDTWLETVEYFKLNLYKFLSDTTYSSSSTAYIRDPVAAVTQYSYAIASSAASAATAATEGGSITFTVTRSASGTASTVYLSTADNTSSASDYQGISNSALSFAANETVKTVTVKTNTDSWVEGSEYFLLNLYQTLVDSTAIVSAKGYIKDPVTVANYSYTVSNPASSTATAVSEGGTITFTITRSSSGTASTVYVATSPGSASGADGDYLIPGVTPVSFAANQTSKTITVTTYTDALTEGSEYFFLTLYKTQADADANTYASYSTAYIKDVVAANYSYTVASSAASAATAASEGTSITFTVTRSASGSASTVYLSTENASTVDADYQGVDKLAMNFAANETVKTLTVATKTDSVSEGSEYFWLSLYKSYADALDGTYASYGTGYIKDPAVVKDYSYTVSNPASSAATAVSEGGAITFTITRSSSGTESTVYVQTASGTASAAGADYQPPGLTAITFAANQTSKTLTVNTYTDTLTEGSEYFFLSLFKTQADADTNTYASYSTAYIKDRAAMSYNFSMSAAAINQVVTSISASESLAGGSDNQPGETQTLAADWGQSQNIAPTDQGVTVAVVATDVGVGATPALIGVTAGELLLG